MPISLLKMYLLVEATSLDETRWKNVIHHYEMVIPLVACDKRLTSPYFSSFL